MKRLKSLFLLLLLSFIGGISLKAQVNPSFAEDDYKKALWMTTRFYGAQRSGEGPNWLLTYHEQNSGLNVSGYENGKSFLKDADTDGYDLVGGWFDCGDHVKYGQTEFYSAYMLLLGYSEFPEGYNDYYSFDYNGYRGANDYTWAGKKGKPNGIPDILDETKYATDYFMKAMRDVNAFYYQVSHGPGNDHAVWATASYKSLNLNSDNGGEKNGSRAVHKETGNTTSMTALCGATLAAMARLYKPFDPAYAKDCLDKALVAYTYVNNTTKGNTGSYGGSQYLSKSQYKQDQVVLYMELYRATGEAKYLTEAETLAGTFSNDEWSQYSYLGYNDTNDLCFYLLAAYGNQTKTRAKQALDGALAKYKPSSGYLLTKTDSNWGVLRYMANQAFAYALSEKLAGNKTTVNPYVIASIDHIFGGNNKNFSFVVGFGSNHVKYPHHRNYYGNNTNVMESSQTQPGLEFGFMAGAQSYDPSVYPDALIPYEASEGGIDYQAGLVGALGYINSILYPVNTGQFGHPRPDLGNDVSICGLNSVVLDSKVPADGKKTFIWKRDNVQLVSNTTSSTYTATLAGEYTCVIDSAGEWQTEGKVKVLDVLPDVDLGEDISLCNPAFVTLDATVESSVVTYQWYKNGTAIEDETNPGYTVYQPGTYKCEIAATGCSSKSDEVLVTSKLPIVADAISDEDGYVTLLVEEEGEYEWYDEPEGGNLLETGNSYSTRITKNTVFYVQDAGSASLTTGPNQSASFSDLDNWGEVGAYFTAEKSFSITGITIKPYQVYSTASVSLSFELRKDGDLVQTYTASSIDVTVNSNSYYDLVFPNPIVIPDVGNYTLIPAKGNSFNLTFYKKGPAYSTYSSDIITFTGATNGTATDNPFPAMFDWQIQAGSGCARAMAQAIYNPGSGSVNTEIITNGICNVYPNPVKDVVYLDLSCNAWDANQHINVEILSMMGTSVRNLTMTAEQISEGINVSTLPQGVYLVRIISGDFVSVKQIIKK